MGASKGKGRNMTRTAGYQGDWTDVPPRSDSTEIGPDFFRKIEATVGDEFGINGPVPVPVEPISAAGWIFTAFIAAGGVGFMALVALASLGT